MKEDAGWRKMFRGLLTGRVQALLSVNQKVRAPAAWLRAPSPPEHAPPRERSSSHRAATSAHCLSRKSECSAFTF